MRQDEKALRCELVAQRSVSYQSRWQEATSKAMTIAFWSRGAEGHHPNFAFHVGQCVQDGNGPGIIESRIELEDGKQAYCLWRIYDDNGRSDIQLSDKLNPVRLGGDTCKQCPFWSGKVCEI
jgi:hypothetical protein